MEKEKKNNLEIVVIILSVLVILLFGYIIFDKALNDDIDMENKMLNLDKVKDYINYDDTYPTMKTLLYENNTGKIYDINLSMDGKVYIHDFAAREYIKGINNAVDIISLESTDGSLETSKCYILTNDGDVYLFRLSNIMERKYESEKVNKVKNVDRLINFSYSTTIDSSSSWGVIAILSNGKYVQLDVAN